MSARMSARVCVILGGSLAGCIIFGEPEGSSQSASASEGGSLDSDSGPTQGGDTGDPTTGNDTGDAGGDSSPWLDLDGPLVTEVFAFDAFDLGDVDGDGRVDLVTSGTGFPPRVTIYPGRGDGSFDRDAAVVSELFDFDAFVVADVDADGRADVLTRGTGFPPRVTVYTGGPALVELTTVEVFTFTHMHTIDLDGDARAELLTGTGDGDPPQIHVWDVATGDSPFDAAVLRYVALRGGDVDGDGAADVVTADAGTLPQLRVHPGDGSGGFGDPAISETFKFSRIDLGDLDGDGRHDLATDVPGNVWRIQLYRSLPAGFSDPLVLDLFNFVAFELADLDGDGRADLVTQATGDPPRVEVWLSRAP